MGIRQRKRINSIGMVTATIRAALVMVVALTMVSIMGFTAFMFWTVYPPNERSENADVVVVIAGASDGRHELGAEIALKYGIKNFVVSNPAGAKDKVGYSHCAGDDRPEGTRTWCMDPYPVITSGEARTFSELAKEQNWESAIMVTSRPHSRRVKYFFERCTELSEVKVANVRTIKENIIIYQVFHELAGFIKFWLTDPC
ncbi:YdcF family protein [Corynebacterium sp. Sa1YVA5]|uniref:YdcF family protein n=2 Tax=Corynebacterium gallinarum TaxID=2762214 RepID=A0A8I0LGW4_9CORY|nr:YdcF family protein [Corynebacterium gallinarum]